MIFFALKICRGGVCCMPAALSLSFLTISIVAALRAGIDEEASLHFLAFSEFFSVVFACVCWMFAVILSVCVLLFSVCVALPRARASPVSLRCGPRARHIYPSLVLVQPSKTRPCLTEILLMGRKESKQTNKRAPFFNYALLSRGMSATHSHWGAKFIYSGQIIVQDSVVVQPCNLFSLHTILENHVIT